MPELGLFPLPIVLVPSERIPLHIFEPRYKELIAECVEEGEEFGLVLAAGDGAVHEVGTRAAVTEVLEELPDGSMNIIVEGGDRFRLLELTDGRSFHTGTVEPLADNDDVPDPADVTRGIGLFAQLVELTGAEVEVPAEDIVQPSFSLASRFELAPELKLELLEETSERVRLKRLCEILETVATAVQRQRETAEVASRNGHVRPHRS